MKKILILLFIPASLFAQVSTPKCTSVSVSSYSEFSSGDIAYLNNEAETNYPYATRMGNASSTYNCHDYAWNKSDGGGAYWMNTPGDDSYWTDGSYIEVPEKQAPYATKVSYASDD